MGACARGVWLAAVLVGCGELATVDTLEIDDPGSPSHAQDAAVDVGSPWGSADGGAAPDVTIHADSGGDGAEARDASADTPDEDRTQGNADASDQSTPDVTLPPDLPCVDCGKLAWARQAGGDAGSGGGAAVAVLADESVLAVGSYSGNATFGGGGAETMLAPFGGGDIAVARYTADGTLLWAKRAGGARADFGKGASAVGAGAFVVGAFNGPAIFGSGEPGEVTLPGAGSYDAVLARYDADGTLLWARGAGGPSFEWGYGVATLPDGTAAMVGSFWSSHAVFGDPDAGADALDLQAGVQEAAYLARYTSSGALLWVKAAQGITTTVSYGVAAAPDSSLTVAGVFWGTGTAVFGAGEPNETSFSTPGTDAYVARYNPDGTLRWARRTKAGAPNGFAVAQGVAVAADGSSVVTGYCGGQVIFGPGEPGETTIDRCVLYVARYGSDGTFLWARTPTELEGDGGRGEAYGRGVAATAGGGAIVVGEFGGTRVFGLGETNATTLTSDGRTDAFVARYYADGGFAWVRQAGGPGVSGKSFVTTDTALGVAVGKGGATYFTGDFFPPAIFGKGEPGETTLGAGSSYQLFLAKLLP
jgi:hypothetical protein